MNINAQNHELDTVKYLEDYTKGFNFYRSGHYDSSSYYLKKSGLYAEENGYVQGFYKSNFGVASVLIAKAQYDSALAIYNGAIAELSSSGNEYSDIIATANFGKGLISYRLLHYNEAIMYYREVKAFRESKFGKKHIETGKVYANLGMTFDLINLFDSSIYYQKKSMQVFADLLGDQHEYVGRMKHNLAIAYNLKGDQETALSLIKDAIEIRESTFGANHIQVALSYRSLGTIYDDMGLWDYARECYQKAISIQESTSMTDGNSELGNLYAQLALNLAYNKDTLLSLEYIQKAQSQLTRSVGKEHALYNLSLENYAQILYELGDYERSIEYFELFQKNYQLYAFNDQNNLAGSYLKKGQALSKLSRYDQALSNYHQALELLRIEMSPGGELASFSSPLMALKTMREIGNVHVINKKYIEANEVVNIAIGVLRKVRGVIQLREDVAVSNQLWNDFNLLAIEVNFHLYEERDDEIFLNNIYAAMNRNRASLIRSRQVDQVSRKKYNVPDSLHLKELNLLSRLSTLQSDLDVDLDLQTKNAQISELMFQIEGIQEVYAKDYREYFASKQQPAVVSLDDYRVGLNRGDISLHYSFTDSLCYILGVSKESILVHRSKDNSREAIDGFRRNLTAQGDSIDILAKNLYAHLVKPVASLLESGKRLTFYSSDRLNYIPMGLLLDDDGAFLLTKYQISYGVSPDLKYAENRSLLTFSENQFLGFAPDFKASRANSPVDIVRNELNQLPGAKAEIETIKQFFDGSTFIGEKATESNFIEKVSSFDIIHLATHAIVDDADPDRSRLIFNISTDSTNDGYLHVAEIYDMDLKAKLVTLSACNTGFGQIRKGEGVISLSHAFAYNGVPATLVSLWPASDKSTPVIMKYFYENLSKGQDKDVALGNAQKSYLQTAKGKARHPFYWGGFVLIGDERPIVDGNSWRLPVVIAVLILLTLLGVGFYRKRRLPSLSGS